MYVTCYLSHKFNIACVHMYVQYVYTVRTYSSSEGLKSNLQGIMAYMYVGIVPYTVRTNNSLVIYLIICWFLTG